jgi:NYN domain
MEGDSFHGRGIKMNMRDSQQILGQRQQTKPRLTALFIDFDNIYISLLSRDRFAATHFATNPVAWTSALLEGGLSTSAVNTGGIAPRRRMVIARVYGNPVLKNKDRSSFAYVRNHFMHAGYEVIDCPPLTNQLKNGSDIRMVLDMRDLLDHTPTIDEFVIMSGDSDFVPILLRLRAHDRRTMIYGGIQTAKSYTSLADEIITEDTLVSFLHQSAGSPAPNFNKTTDGRRPVDPLAEARNEIIAEVAKIVENSDKPVPMEILATSVRNAVGLKRTIDTKWAGHGQFSLLLAQALSEEFVLSEKAPFMVWHKKLHKKPELNPEKLSVKLLDTRTQNKPANDDQLENSEASGKTADVEDTKQSSVKTVMDNILQITDIPPLSARYYQRLFQLITEEISENGFVFAKTAENTAARGTKIKLPVDPSHVQAILHRIRRHGHWFSDTDGPEVLAKAFRDSVISQCLEAGLVLTDSQLDMIDGWFIPSNEGDEILLDKEETTDIHSSVPLANEVAAV